MSKVAIVTDSTAYLPKALCEQYNITVVPLTVIWGEETFEDGVTIQPDAFYARLKTAKVMPSTSQATVFQMQKTFDTLVEQGYEVLGTLISSKLSGTLDSAHQAREQMGTAQSKVALFDTMTTAMAMGFITLAAARVAADGGSLNDCIAISEKARANNGVYFMVDTLEFLHRGGRIGGAQRLLGSALNLKPILTIQDGKVESLDRVRTKGKALERLVDVIVEKCDGKPNVRLATLHASAAEDAKDVLNRAQQRLNTVETVFSEVSPVVGTHTGPGTVGLAYIYGI